MYGQREREDNGGGGGGGVKGRSLSLTLSQKSAGGLLFFWLGCVSAVFVVSLLVEDDVVRQSVSDLTSYTDADNTRGYCFYSRECEKERERGGVGGGGGGAFMPIWTGFVPIPFARCASTEIRPSVDPLFAITSREQAVLSPVEATRARQR